MSMRRSYVVDQPSRQNQRAAFSSDHGQREEKSSNLREKRNLFSQVDHEEAKKAEDGGSETKKQLQLERKPTEDINASADAFIKNFRQQLTIQRLQSIENYEQMLARGL